MSRGNAIVEFAIAAPFLILLLVGVIELGRYEYFGIIVANAAHAGALYGSQSTTAAADNAGMAAAAQLDVGTNPVATLTPSPAPTSFYGCWNSTTAAMATPFPATSSSCPSGQTSVQYVQVTMTGSVKPLIGLPFLPSTLRVTSTATMRVKQ